MNKEEFNKFLQGWKEVHNMSFKDDPIRSISLFSGIKPSGYYTPQVLDYLNHPPYSDRGSPEPELAWFVEIFINDVCIWRQSYYAKNQEDLQKGEQIGINIIIKEMMSSGLHHTWKFQKEWKKIK